MRKDPVRRLGFALVLVGALAGPLQAAGTVGTNPDGGPNTTGGETGAVGGSLSTLDSKGEPIPTRPKATSGGAATDSSEARTLSSWKIYIDELEKRPQAEYPECDQAHATYASGLPTSWDPELARPYKAGTDRPVWAQMVLMTEKAAQIAADRCLAYDRSRSLLNQLRTFLNSAPAEEIGRAGVWKLRELDQKITMLSGCGAGHRRDQGACRGN